MNRWFQIFILQTWQAEQLLLLYFETFSIPFTANSPLPSHAKSCMTKDLFQLCNCHIKLDNMLKDEHFIYAISYFYLRRGETHDKMYTAKLTDTE